jgi:hypothetical protein
VCLYGVSTVGVHRVSRISNPAEMKTSTLAPSGGHFRAFMGLLMVSSKEVKANKQKERYCRQDVVAFNPHAAGRCLGEQETIVL